MTQFSVLLRLRSVLTIAGLLGALVALPGCAGSDITRTFGLVRDAPDEFSVTTRAPLSMPPDYALRPPRPGANRPQELSSRAAAEATLAPGAVLAGPATALSSGQEALLQASGGPAPANIRDKVDADAALARTDKSLADRLLFWKSSPPAGIVVDPAKEQQRLRANAALGQDPSEGETPIIQPKRKSIFDWLF